MTETDVTKTLEQYTNIVTSAFREHTDVPDDVVNEIETVGEELTDATEQQAERIEQLESSHDITQESLWSLEEVVLGEYDFTNRRFEDRSIVGQLDDVEIRIDEVEDGFEDASVRVNGGKTTLHDTLLAETPLEQVCGLTDDESKEHLWQNQHYARNVALIATRLGKKTPKGYVIDNRTLRGELTKQKGERPNDNDVKRVRDFLSDFGKEYVDIVDHRGSKLVVIDKAYAKKLGRTSYAPEECLVVEHKNNWRDMLELHPSGNGSTNAPATA